MKQNKHDDPDFFESYSAMPRSVGGLNSAGERPAFRALLPDLTGRRVLDLGCGFGWHCRYAREAGAASVIGVDISQNMLMRAQEATNDTAILYQRAAIEDVDFPADSFDVVLSSLAIHYVERFDLVCQRVRKCLTAGGAFILSVEHPVFTSREAQDWCYGPDGDRQHWPVDDYGQEGIRHTQWLADDVVKYHRTVASYVNTLLESGFRLQRLEEPLPTPEQVRELPAMKEESRRPIFLLLAAS